MEEQGPSFPDGRIVNPEPPASPPPPQSPTAATGDAPAFEPPGLAEGRYVRVFVPLLVLGILGIGTCLLWRVQRDNDKRTAQITLDKTAERLAARATRFLEGEIDHAQHLARAVRSGRIEGQAQFRAAIEPVIKTSPAVLAIGWVPRAGPTGSNVGACTMAWARTSDLDIQPGIDIQRRGFWGFWIGRARDEHAVRIAGVRRQEDGHVHMAIVTPVFSGEGTAAGFQGVVVMRLDATAALGDLHEDPAALQVEIADGDLVLLKRGAAPKDDPNTQSEAIKLHNRYFWLQCRPTAQLLGQQSGHAALWVLLPGLATALVVSLIVWLVLHRRALAAEEARRQVAALEELTRTAGLISTAPDSQGQVLDRLAGAARRIVGTRFASISIVDVRQQTITMVAADGFAVATAGLRNVMSLEQATGSRHCITTGEMLIVEDVARDKRVFGPGLLQYGVRSAIFVPLSIEGEPIGVLYLSDDRPRRFTPSEVRLAAVLGSQAAVILANNRLAQQKDQALALQKKHQSQREALYQIASEIYRFDNMEESLQQLADSAPRILDIDLCLVCLRTGQGNTLRITAITANAANCRGETLDPSGLLVEQAWQQRRILVIDDAPGESRVHPAYRDRLGVGAIIYLPLFGSDREPIGIMMLVRHQVGEFTQEQVELARALSARAAAAIEKARLYQEARRMAQSQEILLRELNHRVKNNLTSIVTLLTLNRPLLPEQARLWLNRATARVATMARTHELFIGGNTTVSLSDLVAKLLPALGVIKPAGSEIATDCEAPVRLDTERAVNLAMVLNELCWNSLEHGIAEHGVLQIRAREDPPGRLVLEVEDDGVDSEHPRQPITPQSDDGGFRPRGMGLRLVEGLVSRELGGTFELKHKPAGGTLARVEIPLVSPNAPGLS